MTNEEYLDSLPGPDERVDVPERIVCAANKYGDLIIAGVRHGCNAMCDNLEQAITLNYIRERLVVWDLEKFDKIEFKHSGEIQGFLTSKYRFVDRYEAWKIALEQRQIVRRCHGDTKNDGKLFSENLY